MSFYRAGIMWKMRRKSALWENLVFLFVVLMQIPAETFLFLWHCLGCILGTLFRCQHRWVGYWAAHSITLGEGYQGWDMPYPALFNKIEDWVSEPRYGLIQAATGVPEPRGDGKTLGAYFLTEILDKLLFWIPFVLTALFFWKKCNMTCIVSIILSFITAGVLYFPASAMLLRASKLRRRP